MSEASVACPPEPAQVVLKGTQRGLEIQVAGSPDTPALVARLGELLAEAPTFFAGCDARVALVDDGAALAADAAGALADLAAKFALQIVEIGPAAVAAPPRRPVLAPVPLAEGSGATAQVGPTEDSHPYATMSIDSAPVITPPPAPAKPEPVAPKLLIGPVRSGMIVEHPGHLIIIGDVNPGAEVRAEGNIMVLGRLRGVAHAAISGTGFIVALSLQPQQLRIGRMLARAADKDRPSGGPEIAYVAADAIVVERFQGRLPSGLAASM